MRPTMIEAIGLANPPLRFNQEEAFQMAGYKSPRLLEIFRNCDIDCRHLYIKFGQKRDESATELNERYLAGAMETGCHAISACLDEARRSVADVDFLVVCTSTGYVCPDLASRLIRHMRFRSDVNRAAMVGLGCAGAVPTLQRASDFVRANPGTTAVMLAVEICSACYFVDNTMDTMIGNAICGDGAAAFMVSAGPALARQPAVTDFESYIDSTQIDKVGFENREGKLRIILSNAVSGLAGQMI